MVFNSIEYLLFFVVCFCVYWYLLKNTVRGQNIFLLLASYFFYGWWDWRFLGLIALSSVLDYVIGLQISASNGSRKKVLLFISLFVNLGLLAVFKYYDFFVTSLQESLAFIGVPINFKTLGIILPVGISFYTFQTLSYSIDIYRGVLKPTKDFISFSAFISFFPQLVAGPIERAKNLLPQFHRTRSFNYVAAVLSGRQILWGFFKKVVIADNCAAYVDPIFAQYDLLPGWVLLVGVVLFAIQLYCDFSGYSDIAIGTAGLFGFRLMQNFDTPYFSISISDLWRRWHISLSSWAMDYIFLPLTTMLKWFRKQAVMVALFLTFVILGIWHGANWTFVVFGVIHGTAVVVERKFKLDRKLSKTKSSLVKVCGWFYTMVVWLLGLVFFRSDSVADGLTYLVGLTYRDGNSKVIDEIFLDRIVHSAQPTFNMLMVILMFSVTLMFFVEWRNRNFLFGLHHISRYIVVRFASYIFLLFLVVEHFFGERMFIYFQF